MHQQKRSYTYTKIHMQINAYSLVDLATTIHRCHIKKWDKIRRYEIGFISHCFRHLVVCLDMLVLCSILLLTCTLMFVALISKRLPLLSGQECRSNTFEPVHEISNNVVCATSKASDQPAHMRSLIRAFASRLSIL